MRSLYAALLTTLLAACGHPPLPPYAQLGKLVVVTREGLSSYQVDARGMPSGFEHDLVVLFARELGVEARFIVAHEPADVAAILRQGRAHLATAGRASPNDPAAPDTAAPEGAQWVAVPLEDALPIDEAEDAHGRAAASPVWAFPGNGDAALRHRAEAFIERVRADGTLERLADRYFGHARRLGPNDIERFLEKLHSALPHFRRLFVEAQDIHGIDWRLLAALAYQESHWDPLATSWTNVRGMMMLTEDTADRLRVTNRLDARQSILAGARYLVELKEQLPPEVAEPDRTWLAVAAYNLGMGHMNGARFVATLVKRDPDSWYEMKQVLPLLAKPEYYAKLKSGAARGGEAVIMTENVRNYYDILRRYETAAVSPQARSIDARPPM